MKITFTFSDSPNLASMTSDDLCQSHFEFPDTVLQLPDIRDRILTLANLVGQMTKAILHITCKELGLKNYPIKIEKTTNHWIHIEATHPTVLRFQGWDHRRRKSKTIKIIAPEKSGIPEHLTRYAGYTGGFTTLQLAEGKRYPEALKIYQISDLCFSLLSEDKLWQWYPFVQFHPYRFDAAASKRMSKISRKHRREKERLEKQQARAAKAIAEGKIPASTPVTGAGRRIGAVPGIFKGVQFRSQLEIRFVTHLEAKQIRWIYEGERLGDGNYLVDFYLPDLRCWVEVKGKVEPRDDYLLKDIADYLKKERGERLFIYTQSKAFSVSGQAFKGLTHDEFWSKVIN